MSLDCFNLIVLYLSLGLHDEKRDWKMNNFSTGISTEEIPTEFCKHNFLYHLNTHPTMANENNGVFTDLLIAVANPIQNLADTLGNGFNSASSIFQSCFNLCTTIVSNLANTAIQLIQGVTTAVSSAITPKK